jgi:hypothetical protein
MESSLQTFQLLITYEHSLWQELLCAGFYCGQLSVRPVTDSASHWLTVWTTRRHVSKLYFIHEVYRVDINMDKAEMNSSDDGKY